MPAENLKIGARGWRHSQWSGSYYPDDLPEEWQLTYYANNFGVVLVPSEYWIPSKGYDSEEWSEAVSDNFRFYLECPLLEDGEEIQRFQDQCNELDTLIGGVLIADGVSLDGLELPCPVLRVPSIETDGVCVGVIDKDFEDLRKLRVWLELFDKESQSGQKIVFVSNGEDDDIHMESILKVQMLSEMMGL